LGGRVDRGIPIQKVRRDTVRGNDVRRASYKRVSTIGSKDHRGRHRGFEQGIEVSEAFNVEHVDL